MIRTARLEPDIVTYGVLALGCKTIEEATELMEEMKQNYIRINMPIAGAMLRQGCSKLNFPYVLEILKIVKHYRLRPDEKFLTHIENFEITCKKLIRSRKQFTDKDFRHDFNNFQQNVANWKEEMGLDNLTTKEACKKVKDHPWQQFQEPQATGFEIAKHQEMKKMKKKFHNIRKLKFDEEQEETVKDAN